MRQPQTVPEESSGLSLGPGSAVGERGKNKKRRAKRAERKSGEGKGCLRSPIFFAHIDFFSFSPNVEPGPRLQWTLFSSLEDVDFADDLAALSATLSHLQEKCGRLSSFARKTGLHINLKKTQVIYVDAPKHPESPTV